MEELPLDANKCPSIGRSDAVLKEDDDGGELISGDELNPSLLTRVKRKSLKDVLCILARDCIWA